MPALRYLEVDHLSIKDITRIFSKIAVDPVSGCWLWTSNVNDDGYGLIWFRGRPEAAHRVLFAWTVERLPRRPQRGSHAQIPELDHVVCDNPGCCNPCHVALVPHRANVLRSESCRSAINARKQTCPEGHPLVLADWFTKPQRICPVCIKKNGKARRFGPNREAIQSVERRCANARWNGPRHDELLEKQRQRQRTDASRKYYREYHKARRKRLREGAGP